MQILQRLFEPTPPPLPKRPTNTNIKLTNVIDGETVHQRFLLVNGHAGHGTFDRPILVETAGYPNTRWPCVDTYFKALVHLVPGANTITFRLCVDDESHSSATNGELSLQLTIHYVPLLENPPLHLCIFVGRDSSAIFDVPPQKAGQNTLAIATAKLRLAGYLWQAFCAEQMYRNGMGRRTFRLEEAVQVDTTAAESHQKRQTAVVHVIRSRYTVAEIRDVRRAQQSPNRDDTLKDLFGLFLDDLGDHPVFRHPCHVAGLILDSHWDGHTVLGHAALGGGNSNTRLGIFGSHLLHAWPQNIGEVVPCMLDTTPTDTRYVANDANESGEWWRALNIGMGAMLHEVGHAFTLTHTPSGVMSRGYNNWNRTFLAKEPGRKPIPPEDEGGSHWHRVDIMRLRYHPAFRLPSDPRVQDNGQAPSFMPLGDRTILVRTPGGLTLVEVIVNGKYRTHHEYQDPQPLEMVFDIVAMADALKLNRHTDALRLEVTTANQSTEAVDDVLDFLENHMIVLPGVPSPVLKSIGFGHQGLGADTEYQVIFQKEQPRRITGVRVHHGSYLDGVIFQFNDGSEAIVGKRGGGYTDFRLRPNEHVVGMWVRSGAWVDGLQIITSQNRQSPWFGGTGGGLHWVAPPAQCEWVGMFGSTGAWLDQIGIYYTAQQDPVVVT